MNFRTLELFIKFPELYKSLLFKIIYTSPHFDIKILIYGFLTLTLLKIKHN